MIGRRDLDEVCGCTLLEQQSDSVCQRLLVALDREMIVPLLRDHLGGDRTLRQQGVAGDVTAGDVAGFKQRDRHADCVGALSLITVCYGQSADFFWA